MRDGLESAKGYVNELEAVLTSPPPAFDPQTQEQTSRLREADGGLEGRLKAVLALPQFGQCLAQDLKHHLVVF